MALNVLIVDDSDIMRKMVGRAVKLTGLPLGDMREAHDGQVALDVMKERRFDLVLMDINMPRLDGLECLRRMRKDDTLADIPVVMVSTEGSDDRIREIKGLSGSFVRKPFTPEQLVDAVVDAIGGIHAPVQRAAVASDGPDF